MFTVIEVLHERIDSQPSEITGGLQRLKVANLDRVIKAKGDNLELLKASLKEASRSGDTLCHN